MANTIQDKLAYLEETKGLIKQAIIAKGVSVSDSDTFRSYADKITSIQAGGGTTFPNGIKFGYSTFTEVPMFDTSNVTDMSYMFGNCEKLTTVPQFNTINVTDMRYMFGSCTSLQTLPLFDTSNVTNMSSMFEHCEKLTTVPQFNTSNVTNMSSMFYFCKSITTLPLFDTSNVTNMSNMFYFCMYLKTLPLFDTSNVTNMSSMFFYCNELTTLGGFTGLKNNLDISSSSKLKVESVMNVITNASDMTTSPKTLTLHANVFKKLTQEQIATANAKGWNIASK